MTVSFHLDETHVGKSPKRSDELHGIINLPEGFDYKSFLSEAVLSKYGGASNTGEVKTECDGFFAKNDGTTD